MQMRTAAASMDELIGAGLLRRLVRSCVLEVQYEEHTPEPYNPGLQSAGGLSGGVRSTPPPPPRPRRRFDTPAAAAPAEPSSRPLSDGHTQPIWPPPAAELARLTAVAEQYAPPWAAAAEAQYPTPQPDAELSPLTAAEPAPRLELLPPRGPDFTLGPPLLPERAHDPHYYPGISDEPPEPELPRPRWRRWAAFAAGGAVLFGAGMIARSLSGGSGSGAVIDVTPLDSKVSIDGELVPPTSSPRVREDLNHGEHTLEVERRGFISQRRVFNVVEGEREHRIEITLLPEPILPPSAAAAAAPQPAAAAPAPAAAEPPRPTPAPAADDDDVAKSGKQLSARELAKQRRAEKVAERYRARKAAAAEAKASRAEAKASRGDAKTAKASKAEKAAEAKAARAEKAAQAKAEKAEAKAARKGDAGGATALLKLNSTPWSEVYVDDRHVGHTPLLGLPLPAGKHTIRLVNPQLGGKKTLKVRLKAGQTLVKIVKF